MAVISDVPGEDGNENQNEEEQAREVVVNNGRSISCVLPDEITETIIALVSRCNYPRISLMSSYFRRLVTSHEIKRKLNGVSETVLYVFIDFSPFGNPSWYILDTSKIDSFRLARITTFPILRLGPAVFTDFRSMRLASAVVTIGSYMYIIGGFLIGRFYREASGSRDVVRLDCVSHTYDDLPQMQRARAHAAAGVIDGKIYVIGGCENRGGDWVEVFDVETQVWSPVPSTFTQASPKSEFEAYVVMEEKIYALDLMFWFSYEPKQNKWEAWAGDYELWHMWYGSSCVVDDRLYSITLRPRDVNEINVYDPKIRFWRTVRDVRFGLGTSLPSHLFNHTSKLVNLGGKLGLLGVNRSPSQPEIWCAEITLEVREGGEIWGNVKSVQRLLSSLTLPSLELCRTVNV